MRTILVLDELTYSYEAALKFIRRMRWRKSDCSIVYCGSNKAVLKNLVKGPSYAVVPVYNSIGKEVKDVVPALAAYRGWGYQLEVVHTLNLQIHHCLVAPQHVERPEDLVRVISHEQAIIQCGDFLDRIGISPDRRSPRDSTGNAAKKISVLGPKTMMGAIASESAAKAYGLKILNRDIQNGTGSVTTFHLIENQAIVMPLKVAIIGAAGREGKALTAFYERLGCTVIRSDPAIPQGILNSEAVKLADVVIIAVPVAATPLVVRSILPHIGKHQLLMDVTSIKQPAMAEMLQSKAQVVGLHPMCAPEDGFDGQTIVVCPARLEIPYWKTWVVNMLAATGSKLKWSNAPEHDTYMSTIQASPHLANLVSAALIMEMGISTKESLSFTSPFYRVMFSLMGRLLSHDPDLYSGIIMKNPASEGMLEKRIRIERRILKMIKTGDRKSFKQLFLKVRKHFGKDVTEEANELFLRILAMIKSLYSKDTVILEYRKSEDKPGLLARIAGVFARYGVSLTSISSVNFSLERQQFVISFGQPKTSDSVRRSLKKIEKWGSPKVKVIGW